MTGNTPESRRYADAAFLALVRELSFLNTLDTADALQILSQSPYGSLGAVRHLTIYDGAWPRAASQGEWKRHPLILSRKWDPGAAQLAYRRYEQFLRQEASRTFGTDVQLFRTVLTHFPSLRELTLSHVHAWEMSYLNYAHFRNLMDSIWVIPSLETFVAKAMSRLLPVLGTCSRLQRLNVEGLLDARDLEPGRYDNIRHLCLNSVLAGEGLEGSIAKFLNSFPGLTALTIRTFLHGPIYYQRLPLNQICWFDLQFYEILGAWVPENELFDFTERHPLKRLTLKKVKFTRQILESFFSRVRELKPRPNIVCQGVQPSRNSQGGLMGSVESQSLLDSFLAHAEFPWPFSDPNEDIPMFSLLP
ncbi:hypothetical protein MYCTH_2130137 [Thermothelomyces thermophilus ATCC 42464]|uniref:F-box domain-containing protein n=1 Tax=Thermothelomyces thermophilus (strain ATCC 42464 / BCRC 31852 / DSM 1799) TaxID=573729 RepID=G2QM11_THET4|nr:uncharacterized protein MYCTH_2130137 [Thermothelomyces thermophilus ATCC 42464]AEO60991.1 hypothetical protein MYCTH_2130137 [Thermothelomyces thermophilus ATCC 42464]